MESLPEHVWDYIFTLEHKTKMKKVFEQINMLEEVKETLREAKYIFMQYCSRSEHYVDYHRYNFIEDKDDYEIIDDELIPLLDKPIKKEIIEMMDDLSKIGDIICYVIPKFHMMTYKNTNCIKRILPLYYNIMYKYQVEKCSIIRCSERKYQMFARTIPEVKEACNFCVFQELRNVQ